MPDKAVCLIVGAGPGNGLAIARKFGGNGFKVLLTSRRSSERESLIAELRASSIDAGGLSLDCADPETVFATLSGLFPIDVLVYNAASMTMTAPTNLTPQQLLRDLSIDVGSALASVRAVYPSMRERGQGSILITGGGFALKPVAAMASLGIGKAAIRNLTLSLAEELRPQGIRVGTVTILGMVRPGTPLDPEKIADVFWKMHEDRAYELGVEVLFDGT